MLSEYLSLANFGFSSSTVAILCGHLFRMEVRFGGLGISVRTHPSQPGCSTSQCSLLSCSLQYILFNKFAQLLIKFDFIKQNERNAASYL